MVPEPVRPGQRGIQHSDRLPAARRDRSQAAAPGPAAPGRAPRKPAHRVSLRRWRAAAGDPALGRNRPAGGRPAAAAPGGSREGRPLRDVGRRPPSLRSAERPGDPRHPLPDRRPRVPALPERPPHHLRRLVERHPGARAQGDLRGARPRRFARAAADADPVPRFRGLAARLAAGQDARGPAGLLEEADRRHAAARAGSRPAAAGGAHLEGHHLPALDRRGADREARGARPQGRLHPLRHPAGRLPHPAQPLRQPGRFRHRHPDRQPHPAGARRPDRLFRQHPGAAHRDRPRNHVPPADGPGTAHRLRRLRPPGPALREGGRGAVARARPLAHPLFPGDVHPAERAFGPRRRTGGAADGDLRPRGGQRNLEIRADPLPHPGQAGHRLLRIQPRPLRPLDHRAADPPLPGAAARHRRKSGPPPRRLRADDRRRAPPGGARVERHHGRVSRRLPAPAFRAAGGRPSGRPGAGRRRRQLHLPRARRAGQSLGQPADRPGPAGRKLRRRLHRPLLEHGGRPARRAQGRLRLPADGPGLPGRPAGLHDRGQPRQSGAEPLLAEGQAAGIRWRGPAARRSCR